MRARVEGWRAVVTIDVAEGRRPLDGADDLGRVRRLLRAAQAQGGLGRSLLRFATEQGGGDPVERLVRCYEQGRLELVDGRRFRALAPPVGAAVSRDDEPLDGPAATRDTTDWIEIRLVDADKQPVANEPWQLVLSSGRLRRGRTDDRGVARLDGIVSGTCQLTFPRRDGERWRRA